MIVKTLSFYILSEFIIDKCEKTQDPLVLKPVSFVMDAEKGHFVGLRRRKLWMRYNTCKSMIESVQR